MPNEPLTPIEPTTEELSAYLDHELDAEVRTRVAEHVAGCSECQARLDGLRQAMQAIRGLPMETPPRKFTIPEASRRAWRWAPVGWIGGVAAAFLVIVVGVQQLHGPAATTAGPVAERSSANYSGQAPAASTLSQSNDQAGAAFKAAAGGSSATVVDPTYRNRRLMVGIDQAAYAPNGSLTLSGSLFGSTTEGQIRVYLRRGNYGIELGQPAISTSPGSVFGFRRSYSLGSLALPNPPAGSYTLVVIWTAGDGSGSTLFAELPLTIT
jgi:hypothetical protein